MKTKILRKAFTIIFVGALNIYNAQSQTAYSGTASNGCTPAAGTLGTDNTSIGCGAGGSFGVTTFEWTKKLSPEALTLQNETRKNTLQQRIQN